MIPSISTPRDPLKLQWPPKDTVSHCSFHPQGDQGALLVASWDSRVKIYTSLGTDLTWDYSQPGPVLAACWLPNDPRTGALRVLSAGADCNLWAFNCSNPSNPRVIGKHQDTVKCLAFHDAKKTKLVVSASWDCTLCTWEMLEEEDGGIRLKIIQSLQLPTRPHSMDVHEEGIAVVACDERVICIVELQPLRIIQKRTSSLRHPTRAVACFPQSSGTFCWATSSCEGRVAIDWLKETDKSYAFKCHRSQDMVSFPVNALAVHPGGDIFATGGSDGHVILWSRGKKRRLMMLPRFSTTIAECAFSHDGRWLVIAASYVWDRGDEGESEHSIYVYPIYAGELGL